MSKTLKETIVRRNNPANITYVMKLYTDNTYEFTTLVLRSGCYVVSGRTTGTCS
tara:strand:- start:936 stop:1097 length:162 start_codon:yes stop_codon:yes gene_type:complete